MIPNPYKGKFICVEGLDGSGKATQGKRLFEFLKGKGLPVILTSEPTSGPIGSRIRRILKKEEPAPGAYDFQKMFSEDRKRHCKKIIIPALKSGTNVVTLRYEVSTQCYGQAFGVPEKHINIWNASVIKPDLTIIIDASAQTCLERLGKRNQSLEYFEKLDSLEKIARHYRRYGGENHGTRMIDGELSEEEVFEKVVLLANELFRWSLL